jgi:hypothetical protein
VSLWTGGWNFKNQGGSFAKVTAEGVSFNTGRRISNGRLRLDRGVGERVRRPELGEITVARWPVMAGAR